MRHQTAAEYIKERLMKMYEDICPECKSHLDVGEKCKCRLINKMKESIISGERVSIELNRMDFSNVKIRKVTEQEVMVEDSEKRIWDIDMDSIVEVK